MVKRCKPEFDDGPVCVATPVRISTNGADLYVRIEKRLTQMVVGEVEALSEALAVDHNEHSRGIKVNNFLSDIYAHQRVHRRLHAALAELEAMLII